MAKKEQAQGLDKSVGKKALREVPIYLLNVDPSYQRGLVPKHKKIASEFDKDALGVPLVGQREDGTLWIVDGQQRIAALKILDKKSVRCDVFVSRGPEHEAHVFKLVNQNRTKLRSYELFHALLAAGDVNCHAVKEIVEKAGFRLVQSGKETMTPETQSVCFHCVNTLLKAYESHGATCLKFILEVLFESWPDDPIRVRTEIVEGLMLFWSNQKGVVDRDKLVARFKAVTPSKLLYSAGMGIGSRGQNVAEAILRVYRRRGKRAE